MVYKIGWRNQMKNGLISQTIWGLTRYSSREQAEKQITLWSALFPQNTYYCEAQ